MCGMLCLLRGWRGEERRFEEGRRRPLLMLIVISKGRERDEGEEEGCAVECKKLWS